MNTHCNHKYFGGIISLLGWMTITLFFLIYPLAAKEDVKHLKSNLRRLKAKLHLSRTELERANREESKLASSLAQTRRDLNRVEADLRQIKTRLQQAKTRLDLLQQSIRFAKVELAKAQFTLEKRLREIYEEGEVSYLEVLFKSTSFTDFLNQTEYLQDILASDQELIREVKRRKEELERRRRAARQTILEIQAEQEVYEHRRADLDGLYKKQIYLMSSVRAHRRKLSAYVSELEHISQEMELRLERLIRNTKAAPGSLPASSGRFIYPVHGPITSGFGYRRHPIRGTVRFHSGLDFGVPYGTPVHAADNGVVIFAGWYGGYGNTVIVKHRGGYSTLYAHASKLYVRVGQKVRQGQVVSAVGSTGMSTGPHLHFEVRRRGTPIDPRGVL